MTENKRLKLSDKFVEVPLNDDEGEEGELPEYWDGIDFNAIEKMAGMIIDDTYYVREEGGHSDTVIAIGSLRYVVENILKVLNKEELDEDMKEAIKNANLESGGRGE